MKVYVESCFNGHGIYQRLTMPDGNRVLINSESWNRAAAIEGKDMICRAYKVNRKNIRFNVK